MGDAPNPFEPPKTRPGADAGWKILPSERFDLLSESSPEEVLEDLRDWIAPVRRFRGRWSGPRVPFEGTVRGSSFDCSFIGHSSTSSNTRIQGVVMPHARGGSRIRCNVSLQRMNVFCLLAISAVAVYLFAMGWAHEQGGISRFVLPLGLALLGWFVFAFPLRKEAKRARARLIEQLEARSAPPEEVGLE